MSLRISRVVRTAAIAAVASMLVVVGGCSRERNIPPREGGAAPRPGTPVAAPSPSPGKALSDGMRLVGGDEFNGTVVDQNRWGEYDSPGNNGLGVRRPGQITESGGAVTLSCTTDGRTGGMMYLSPFKYGLWEARVKMSPASANVHPVLLLWPVADNWPAGGEVDYLEVFDPARGQASGFLHYGVRNAQTEGSVGVDLTQYHVFAVRWAADGVSFYVDGRRWFDDPDPAHLPPGPMQATIQLDYFGGVAAPATMTVDWLRVYQ